MRLIIRFGCGTRRDSLANWNILMSLPVRLLNSLMASEIELQDFPGSSNHATVVEGIAGGKNFVLKTAKSIIVTPE